MTYLPDAGVAGCNFGVPLQGKVLASLPGTPNSEVTVTLANPLFGAFAPSEPFAHVHRWGYDSASSMWGNTGTSTGAVHVAHPDDFTIADVVVGDGSPNSHFWINASWDDVGSGTSSPRLMRGRTDQNTAATMGGSFDSISALALDADGRAYVVAKPSGANYELRRYPSSAAAGTEPSDGEKATLAHATAAPVGSPILGEPRAGNLSEVYVVTTDGTVHAFDAENMQPLWRETLLKFNGQPITIAAKAQPVLRGNRLWVASEDGVLYAVVVNSNGLSRSAQWPTMYRDNCRSNSHYSTQGSLPSCF